MRRLFTVGLVLVALAAAGVTSYELLQSPTTATGIVEFSPQVDLNFVSDGPIADVRVTPGARVAKGQVLVTQDTTALSVVVTSDKAVVAADQAQLGQLQNPHDPAQIALLQTQVDHARSALQQAIDELNGTTSTSQADLNLAKTTLDAANQALAADTAAAQRIAGECSQLTSASSTAPAQARSTSAAAAAGAGSAATSSNAPRNATPSSSGSADPTQPNVPLQTLCAHASQQVVDDQNAVAVAQQQYNLAQSQATAATSAGNRKTDLANMDVRLAQGQQSVGLLPSTPAQLAAEQATLAQDTAQLTKDSRQLSGAVITAPFDGIVGRVSGTVGALATPDGVHLYQSAGAQPQSQSGFTLFPEPATTDNTNSPQFAPVVTLLGNDVSVVAQVSEDTVANLHQKQQATITFPAGNDTAYHARVETIQPQPVDVNGHVYYLVDLALTGPLPANLLPGMSADITF